MAKCDSLQKIKTLNRVTADYLAYIAYVRETVQFGNRHVT